MDSLKGPFGHLSPNAAREAKEWNEPTSRPEKAEAIEEEAPSAETCCRGLCQEKQE